MTFKEMIDRVRLTLGMSETVSNDEGVLIKAWLNEGVVDLLSRTRPYTRHINLTVQPGTAEHDMAGTIISLVDVVAPAYGKLDRLTRGEILRAQKAGTPAYAYEEPLFWYSPIVSEPTVIVAYGVFRPSKMIADADDPANPNFGGLAAEFHPAVLNYALWQAGQYVQHQGSNEGEKWRIYYEGQDGLGGDIARIKRILTKRVTPTYSRRANMNRNMGELSPSGSYIGANGS